MDAVRMPPNSNALHMPPVRRMSNWPASFERVPESLTKPKTVVGFSVGRRKKKASGLLGVCVCVPQSILIGPFNIHQVALLFCASLCTQPGDAAVLITVVLHSNPSLVPFNAI